MSFRGCPLRGVPLYIHTIRGVPLYIHTIRWAALVPHSVQVKVFVEGLFHLNNDIPAFKEHLRDFLVQIKVSKMPALPYLDCDMYMIASFPGPRLFRLYKNSLRVTENGVGLGTRLRNWIVNLERHAVTSAYPPTPVQEFAGDDPTDLFLEEREGQLRQAADDKRRQQLAVPGIINPHDRPDEMQE